jgi:hypothetical protein
VKFSIHILYKKEKSEIITKEQDSSESSVVDPYLEPDPVGSEQDPDPGIWGKSFRIRTRNKVDVKLQTVLEPFTLKNEKI